MKRKRYPAEDNSGTFQTADHGQRGAGCLAHLEAEMPQITQRANREAVP
jgi:hypothetical protein